MEKKKQIIRLLEKNKQVENVERFASYVQKLNDELDRVTKAPKNPWMQKKTADQCVKDFLLVQSQGLVFDGKHITYNSLGISFDYQAYKNKMLIAYPESKIDVQIVKEGDEFEVSKDSGEVNYTHKVVKPFEQLNEKNIIGAYCIIKNSRGNFLTTLGKDDIEKHRKVAKQDLFWQKWFQEMVLKTVIKKGCKTHFDDVTQEIEEIDNEQNDVENPIDLPLDYKKEVDAINSEEELKAYYLKNKGIGKEFDQYVIKRRDSLRTNES
jgi:hypothetical protein